jgi:hypothetical protein
MEEGAENPIDHEPGNKEVEALEGVEADVAVVAEAGGGKDDDGRDPSDDGYITKESGGARLDTAEEVGWGRDRGRRGGGGRRAGVAWGSGALFCATEGAIDVVVSDRLSALVAEGHP